MNNPQDVNARKFRRKNKQNKPKDERDNVAVPPQAVTGGETAQRIVGKQKQERSEATLVKVSYLLFFKNKF